ncbi:MAG: aminoacyl-histidine dipeptidase, partial [Bacteroidota bacterium]
MSLPLETLQPHALWQHFTNLNAVPRASKKEEQVIQFMVDFGKSLNLLTQVDEVGNVIIKKPATAGMEDRQTVVMQSHLDMVHQKNNDTDFDFATEGIRMLLEGDWIKADGTTLGADNGIGVASIMAMLSSTDIPHPPLEALFTIDEETGMTGAMGLKGGLLEGSIMLNLDTEDDNELTIGCAGGVDVTASGSYDVREASFSRGLTLTIKGLTGGHSGMDIYLGRGNANKLMNRLLLAMSKEFGVEIGSIDGGGLRNAIPRESVALIAYAGEKWDRMVSFLEAQQAILQTEYASTDEGFSLVWEATDAPEKVMDPTFLGQLLRAIYACPNGIFRMSPEIEGLVQTSNNLARVLVKDSSYEILCLTRGSVDSEKNDLAQMIESTFELMGANVSRGGEYPGWAPKPDAPIVKLMADLYVEMFPGEQPLVSACHAGLECGILGTNYPDMDMISFGPNIRGAHSPDETVQVSSVQKFWKFLL